MPITKNGGHAVPFALAQDQLATRGAPSAIDETVEPVQ
jgi:hypothetical protein